MNAPTKGAGMQRSGGFDISRLSTASKIMLISGILLLFDSFLRWQEVCIDLGALGGDVCAGANAWSGNGGFAGVIMGILLIVLLIWEVVQLGNMASNLQIGIPPTKGSAYLGFAVAIFGLLKFILAITNEGTLWAWVGLVLLVALAYGSWMKFQEMEAAPMTGGGGGDSGFGA
jgi:hypothetical protein